MLNRPLQELPHTSHKQMTCQGLVNISLRTCCKIFLACVGVGKNDLVHPGFPEAKGAFCRLVTTH